MRRLAALFRRLSHRSLLIPVAIGMGVTTVAKDLRANHGATAYHYRVDLSERDEVYAAAHAVKQEVVISRQHALARAERCSISMLLYYRVHRIKRQPCVRGDGMCAHK